MGVTIERLGFFSDAVFAVIITIMVLQLKLPDRASFDALLGEWPTAISYLVSYLLITIMWINHHFLLRFATAMTPRLILLNFFHMFAASLVPFSTAWVAATRLAPVPVFVYAATIVLVNISYHVFAYYVVPRGDEGTTARTFRSRLLSRSTLTLCLFTVAMLLALKFPLFAFALVTLLLTTYARPDVPGMASG